VGQGVRLGDDVGYNSAPTSTLKMRNGLTAMAVSIRIAAIIDTAIDGMATHSGIIPLSPS
jgi:hypothetical protein